MINKYIDKLKKYKKTIRQSPFAMLHGNVNGKESAFFID